MSVMAAIMKGPLSYLIVVLVTQCLNFTSLCGRDILDRHVRDCAIIIRRGAPKTRGGAVS